MFKPMLILSLISLLLVSVPSQAISPSAEDKQEFAALKMEQAKLHAKERLLKLKLALNLRPEQMDAWATYEKHVYGNAGNKIQMAAKLRKQKAETGQLPTSIDLAEANIERLKSQLATAKEGLVAFSGLYNILDDEQQAIVDKGALRRVKKIAQKARKLRKKKDK